jgi:hypothetical protein
MNKLRFILTFIFLSSFFPSFIAAQVFSNIMVDSFEETAGTGLVIFTNPPGVRVFIDGIEMRRTPVDLEFMTQGTYDIRLTREGYRDRSLTVTLFNTSRLIVSIKMEEERGLALVSVHKAEGSPELLPLSPLIFANTFDVTTTLGTTSDDNKFLLDLPAGYNIIMARAFGWIDESISVLVNDNSTVEADIFMKPAPFGIRNSSQTRRLFNPLNSSSLGLTEFRFDVSAPGTGIITILDDKDLIVYKRNLQPFDTWHQHITWNGRDSSGYPLPEGNYTILIEVSALPEFTQGSTDLVSIKLEIEIDYSINIFPLSLESGISGLTFAPMPQVLPLNSFQVDAGILFGGFNMQTRNIQNEAAVLIMPFMFNMRVVPVNRLEFAASLNINTYFNNHQQTEFEQAGFVGFGISGSTKFNIIDNSLLSFAAGISYSWAGELGELPLGAGKGIGIYTPISMELSNFSLVFSPALFWHGPTEIISSLFLCTGVLYRSVSINTGLSMRYELNFNENISSRFLTGAEIHFFPPPSNFVFSFLAGIWVQGQSIGGYGGLKIGIIN